MEKPVHIGTPSVEEIDVKWVQSIIATRFTRKGQNITPLRILEKVGVPIANQVAQLRCKNQRLKIKRILFQLSESGYLKAEKVKHDTLGVKEDRYKLI